LGLAYLAATLRALGRDVTLIDAYALNWSWRQTRQAVARLRPDVLGLGCMTPVADVAYRAAKSLRPLVGRVLLGGPHATAIQEKVLTECSAVDHAVVGEGEEVIGPYLDWIAAGETDPPPPGVLSRNRPFRAHKVRGNIVNIEWPARDLLPQRNYRYLMATRPGFATMVTSRGCPFRCSFCDKSVSGSRWRARPAQDVVDEMAHLVRHHGVGFINFYDDNFTLSRRRVAEICEALLLRGVDVDWKCEGRVDGVDLPLLRLMRRAGCRTIAYGVESGHAETLKSLRKDVNLDQVVEAFAATRAAGIRSLAYIILGAPGEKTADVEQTLQFVREIQADYVQFSSLTAFPGTDLHAAHADQILMSPAGTNPVDSEYQRAVLTDLSPPELARLLRRAWVGFYLRPRPIARLARDAMRSGSLGEGMRLGASLARWSIGA
jgi:radical SAM superfamily enzyme YgiQ (UPF0313 family)